jgi:hypothetical protein
MIIYAEVEPVVVSKKHSVFPNIVAVKFSEGGLQLWRPKHGAIDFQTVLPNFSISALLALGEKILTLTVISDLLKKITDSISHYILLQKIRGNFGSTSGEI